MLLGFGVEEHELTRSSRTVYMISMLKAQAVAGGCQKPLMPSHGDLREEN